MWLEIVGAVVFISLIKLSVTNFSSASTAIGLGAHQKYKQAGLWYDIKFYIFQLIYWVRRKQKKSNKGQGGYGQSVLTSSAEMDRVQELSTHPLAVDAVFFTSSNRDGIYIVTAAARRPNNITQIVLHLRLPDIGMLSLPIHPDTTTQRTNNMSYESKGLSIKVIEPMLKWNIKYIGELRLKETDTMHNVNLDLMWESTTGTDCFNFDTDMHPDSISDAIARENWSRDFFKKLEDAHQTHYEQFGTLKGQISIDGYGERQVDLKSMRDHTYGKYRDWDQIHRYAIQWFHLEDNTRIGVGIVSYPYTLSYLTIGYVFTPAGEKQSVSSCDLKLWEHGEDGRPPNDVEFNFTAGGHVYHVRIQVAEMALFYMKSLTRPDVFDARVHERMCTFQVQVDGGSTQQGWGFSEWEYNNNTFGDGTIKAGT